MINELVKLKKKKPGGDKYRYTRLIDTKYSMNNVDVGLHSNDKNNKNIKWNIEEKISKRKRLKKIKFVWMKNVGKDMRKKELKKCSVKHILIVLRKNI